MPDEKRPTHDEPVKIDLDPEEALKALLRIEPEAQPVESDPLPPRGAPLVGE